MFFKDGDLTSSCRGGQSGIATGRTCPYHDYIEIIHNLPHSFGVPFYRIVLYAYLGVGVNPRSISLLPRQLKMNVKIEKNFQFLTICHFPLGHIPIQISF
jgi:hypothetical protein